MSPWKVGPRAGCSQGISARSLGSHPSPTRVFRTFQAKSLSTAQQDRGHFQLRKLPLRDLTSDSNPLAGGAWLFLGLLEESWWVGLVC